MLTRGLPGKRSSSAARAIASGVNSSSSSRGGDAGSARSQNASPIAGARAIASPSSTFRSTSTTATRRRTARTAPGPSHPTWPAAPTASAGSAQRSRRRGAATGSCRGAARRVEQSRPAGTASSVSRLRYRPRWSIVESRAHKQPPYRRTACACPGARRSRLGHRDEGACAASTLPKRRRAVVRLLLSAGRVNPPPPPPARVVRSMRSVAVRPKALLKTSASRRAGVASRSTKMRPGRRAARRSSPTSALQEAAFSASGARRGRACHLY